ncbi:transport protein [Aquipluma nitroreducens]|uniref:Transport protein n=1 Tax=Aquipluma nitroreducens TaxID=2010828 RepID=A0A5K7SDG8_9BACT|nr:MFS transporter [Aquipluma nitroreducens]BBE19651.1 transport protein [Aquipluma nitroreducens]
MKRFPENTIQLYLIKIAKWFNLIMPIVVLFYQENGLTMSQIFILKSIYSIAMVATELPSGYLADVWGCRRTLLLGAILGTIGIGIYCISADFASFAVAEIILGVGFSFISGADSALLYDSLKAENREEEYIKYEGRITSAGNFAEALAGVAGGLLATFSLRTPYYFQVFVAAIAIPAAYFLKEPQHIQERIKSTMNEILSIVKLTYQQKEMRSAIMISSFTGAATLTYAWFVQPYFQKAGVPVSVFGILWTLLNLSAGVFSMFSYKIERFLGNKKTLLFIVIFISLGFVLTSLQISLAGIAILFGFYMVRGIATPVLKDQINQYTDSKVRATILSVRNLEIRIIFAAIGPALGYLTDTFSLSTALMVTGIIYFVAGMMSIMPFLEASPKPPPREGA